MKGDTRISVLLPTRGRTDALARSVRSLMHTVADPHSMELLLGFDSDDEGTAQWFIDNVAPELDLHGIVYTVMEFEPLGYIRLNEYVNTLAKAAAGTWLMFWNDDALMKTQAWDQHIFKHDDHFRVLRMPTHREHPYAIFPILPRTWYELFGYVSAHQISDAWVSQIAYMLDIMHDIPVEVLHDRHDLTGNNKDTTYKERVMLEGQPSNPKDFNHITWRQRRMRDATHICEHLEGQGIEMPWFRSVLAGTQDPWAKMTGPQCDPNGQLRIYR